ncbi:hypothetical protein [Paenibacillus aestuarii]|uniref:Spore coat protein n=1 Tax=Paenibacillus aestuarii TaxID=516965 RepID=A0ABW0KH19_9BACL|nr:hypothetical protein [Paenibacillus aestuarii]
MAYQKFHEVASQPVPSPLFIPPAPLPSTAVMIPGIKYWIPNLPMATYGTNPQISVYGQPFPPQLQQLPSYPPYYQTPPQMVTTPWWQMFQP